MGKIELRTPHRFLTPLSGKMGLALCYQLWSMTKSTQLCVLEPMSTLCVCTISFICNRFTVLHDLLWEWRNESPRVLVHTLNTGQLFWKAKLGTYHHKATLVTHFKKYHFYNLWSERGGVQSSILPDNVLIFNTTLDIVEQYCIN